MYQNEPFVYFGSYFKGTKVHAVNEYDVLVVIDSNNGQFSNNGGKIGNGLGTASPNNKYEGKRYFKSDGSGVSPVKMLNWLKGVVEEVVESFGGEAPERNGQAVTAIIKSQDLKIDLVPAGIFEHVGTKQIFYDIPSGSRDNDWILTAPKQDMEELNLIASIRNNFKNVIRILKRIKDAYHFSVASFAIERSVVEYARQNNWYNNLYWDVNGALTYLSFTFRSGKISDPFGQNNNLLSDVHNLQWYAERLDKISSILNECLFLNDPNIVYKKVYDAFENSISSSKSQILGIDPQKRYIEAVLRQFDKR